MSNFTTSDIVINAFQDWWDEKITRNDLDTVLCSYLSNTDGYIKSETKKLYTALLKIIFSKETIKDFYYVMSALFRLTMIPDVLYEILRSSISDDNLSKEMKRFIYGQCINYVFLYKNINTSQTRDLLDDLYEVIYQSYLNDIPEKGTWIPVDKRNQNLVVVFTSQVLGLNHGPTKTLLDRCNAIETKLNQKVYIINTADALTPLGIIDWFDTRLGNYYPNLDSKGVLSYRDKEFSFYQCPQEMPQVHIIAEIVRTILSEKPKYIISIGDNNITADICSKIVPVLTVTLGPSERARTRSTFQMTGHKTDSEDLAWLNKHKLPTSHIIEGLFTSAFKPQTHKYVRSDFNFDENWFICIIVGARLYSEVDDTFLDVISKLAAHNIYSVFMGDFHNYKQKISTNDILKKHTRYIGFQDDAMAVYDCCNLYLNPIRSGGGTSAAEALFKGLPVITIDYGDVSIGVGETFQVSNYDEMVERAIKLATDKKYYIEQSKKAKEQAARLTDTDGEFIRIIKEMESRPEFI